jgi:hypothetical protein
MPMTRYSGDILWSATASGLVYYAAVCPVSGRGRRGQRLGIMPCRLIESHKEANHGEGFRDAEACKTTD